MIRRTSVRKFGPDEAVTTIRMAPGTDKGDARLNEPWAQVSVTELAPLLLVKSNVVPGPDDTTLLVQPITSIAVQPAKATSNIRIPSVGPWLLIFTPAMRNKTSDQLA